MSHSVAIIDYDAGNMDSVKRAVEECGGEALITKNPQDLNECSHIILPGVGVFKEGIKRLRNIGMEEALREQVLQNKIPFLGICLGMQLLASRGTEGGDIEGLGFIQGEVIKLVSKKSERIPHIGWNNVVFKEKIKIFKGIDSEKDFYFVHSYHFIPSNKEDIVAVTPYCGEFVSAVAKDNIFGVQFHPEKSQVVGFQLLKNFLSI